METVRIGIVGLGNMGKAHLANIRAGKIPGLRVTALCESVGTLPNLIEGEKAFTDVNLMMRSGHIDAILICTPHFSHTTIGIAALQAGLHVLVESRRALFLPVRRDALLCAADFRRCDLLRHSLPAA